MVSRRKNRARIWNCLDSTKAERPNLEGFMFVLEPTRDPIAWDALLQYATVTPNMEQKEALMEWFKEHKRPEE